MSESELESDAAGVWGALGWPILANVLRVVSEHEGIQAKKIMHMANTPWTRLAESLNQLINHGLIAEKKHRYTVTEEGLEFLGKYRILLEANSKLVTQKELAESYEAYRAFLEELNAEFTNAKVVNRYSRPGPTDDEMRKFVPKQRREGVEKELRETESEETIYARVFPHPTGKGQYSLEVLIPKDVRDQLGISKETPLYVRIEGGKLVYERAPTELLRQSKRE